MNIRKIRRAFAIIMVCIMLSSIISPDRLIDGTYMNMVDAEETAEVSLPKEDSIDVKNDLAEDAAGSGDNTESDSNAMDNVSDEQSTSQNKTGNTDTDNESKINTDSEVRNDSQYIDNENASDVQNSLEKDYKDENDPGIEQDSDIKQNDNIEALDNSNDGTNKTNSKKNTKTSDVDEIKEDDIEGKLDDASSAVGKLIVTNLKVWYKGQPLEDGITVSEGDDISLAFDWRINNNENGITRFATKLEAVNSRVTDLKGPLYYEGEQIATYTIDRQTDMFIIDLDSEAVEGMSNIGGGALLAGTVNISDDRSEPDGSEHPLGFGNYVKDVIYSNPGNVDFDKTAPKNGEKGNPYSENDKIYFDYEITLKYQEIMNNISITDTVDAKTELDVNSIKITSVIGNNAEQDVTDSVQKTAIATGFTVKLDNSTGKADETTYTISYRVALKDSDDFKESTQIINDAKLTYTDETGGEKSIPKSVTTKINKPDIDKTGSILTDEDGNVLYKRGTYNGKSLYCYPVKYTLKLNPKDFKGLLANDEDAVIELNDTLSGGYAPAIEDYDWMFHNGSGPNFLSLMNAGYVGNTSGFFDSSWFSNGASVPTPNASTLYIGDKQAFSGDDELKEELVNTMHIFGVGTSEVPTSPATYYRDYEIKLSEFEKKSDGTYEYSYVIFVPSENLDHDVFNNNIDAKIYGVPFDDSTSTSFDVPQPPILVKGPMNTAFTNIYTKDSKESSGTSEQKLYQYTNDLEEGQSISYIDYAVALRLDTFRYQYDSKWKRTGEYSNYADKLEAIHNIKIVDRMNGFFSRNYQNPDTSNLSQSSRSEVVSLNPSTLDQVMLEIYVTPNAGAYNPTLRAALNKAEEELLNYGETYGWRGDASSQKEGYDDTVFWNLYVAYRSAEQAFQSSGGCLGSMTWDDLQNTQGYNITVNNNNIVVDIDPDYFSGSTFKRYYYDSDGVLKYSSGGAGFSNLDKFVEGPNGSSVYQLVLRYRVKTSTEIVDTATLYNGAGVYFDDDMNTTDDPYAPVYANSQVTLSKASDSTPTDTIAVTKSSNDITFSDQKLSYTDGKYSYGWNIRVDIRKALAGEDKKLVITDALPEGLTFTGTDNGDCVAFAAPGTSVSSRTLASCQLPSDYYTISTEGNQLTVTIPYTDDFANVLKNNYGGVGYLNFYFRTYVDENTIKEMMNSGVKRKSFVNKATVLNGDVPYTTSNVTRTFNLADQITKDSMDADFTNVLGKPVVDVKNNVIYGYYRIEVNPYAITLGEEGELTVKDQMTEKMILDPNSVKAIDVETGNEITVKQSVSNDNLVQFTIPDKTHAYIDYKVTFNVNPSREPDWMKVENTKNSCEISAYESTETTIDEVDFSSFASNISVWSYQMTGDISVFKFWNNNGDKTVLPGATFKVYSVYDNNGNTYPDLSKDDVYQRYKDGLVSTADGTCDFKRLPLDRIYKLVETAAPDDVSLDADNEYYFILEGNFGVEIPDFLKDKDVKVFHTGNIISYENKKVVAVSGSKTWKDEDDKDGIRPVSITVHLLADGKEIDKKTVTAKDNWKWDFGKLPRNKEDGTEIVYSVKEDVVTGYETEYNGFDIVNTHKAKEETTTEATTEVTTETTTEATTEATTETTTEKKKKTTTEEKTTETSKKTGSSSKTGDASETGAAAGALVISVIGLFVLMYRRKEL